MKKSELTKQIIICIIIIVVCGICAIYIKNRFFPSENKNESFSTEVKDKYGYNEFQLVNVTNEVLIQRYFVDFKNKLLYDSEKAYSLLDSNTKKKYNTYEDFKDYIDNNMENIIESSIVKFDIRKGKNNTTYILIDQFNNMYTFVSKAVLVYKVNLDLYNENASIFD